MQRIFNAKAGRAGLIVWAVAVLGTVVSPAAAATPAQIQASIDRGKKYLYGLQKNGNWEIVPAPDSKIEGGYRVENGQYGGLTAIATYALLASGESYTDPRIQQAIQFLRKAEIHGIYALGMRTQVWNSIPQEQWVKDAFAHDRDLLISGICNKGLATGFLGYTTTWPKDQADKSTAQFGVLGLWACNQAHLEINHNVWQLFDKVWHAQQFPDGGWCYDVIPGDDDQSKPTVSMTAAGVATLFITQEYTNYVPKCTGNIRDAAIDKGINYLGNHLNNLQQDRFYYSLFGISRVGLASGFKFIGKTDWFQWGADKIVAEQKPEGFWTDGRDNTNNVPETSFALLFLARGRAPVLFEKLDYDVIGRQTKASPSTWNQRPRDVANLTREIGRELESQLNWQVVNLHLGKRDLIDAPIIIMTGSTPPKLNEEDAAVLRQYIEEGGMVIGNADCSNAGFAEGFRKMGEEMFPGRKFAELPADHPIYASENFNRSLWKTKPQMEGLDNGSRTLMLLLPTGDPAKLWQAQEWQPVKVDVYKQLMINIVLYAVDKEGLRTKGDTYMVARNDAVVATAKVKVARLKYAGNWNPEPGGWRRLANVMHNDDKLDLQIQEVEPGKGQLDKSFQLAVLTVGGAVGLTDEGRKEIAAYVAGGGTLEVDVAGGRGESVTEAEALLAKLFPETKDMPVLPPESPVYGGTNPSITVSYRRLGRTVTGQILHRPQVRGLTRDKRIAVLFSPQDLATGLVGQPNGGVIGYDPASATKVMADIVKYAAHH
jgi:hypothetical protein